MTNDQKPGLLTMLETMQAGIVELSDIELAEQLEAAARSILEQAMDADTIPAATIWMDAARRLREKARAKDPV